MIFSYYLLFLVLIIVLVNHVAGYEVPDKVYYDLDHSEYFFQSFLTKHKKKYDAIEYKYRLQVFESNLKWINELNQEYDSTVFGITKFTDLTPDEMKMSTSCLRNVTNVKPLNPAKIEYPEELDYRQQNLVTEVKNQGYCGSCYIFGAMADIEGQYAKRSKKLVSLSEQYVLDCDSKSSCFGGLPEWVYRFLASTPGPIKTEDYPYEAEKKACKADPSKAVVKVKETRAFSVNSTQVLRTLLFNHGPLSIGVDFSNEMWFYKGGIMKPKFCDISMNHDVALIGYGHTKKESYWLIKNSWGKDWGEDGYMRLAFHKCFVGQYVSASELA